MRFKDVRNILEFELLAELELQHASRPVFPTDETCRYIFQFRLYDLIACILSCYILMVRSSLSSPNQNHNMVAKSAA